MLTQFSIPVLEHTVIPRENFSSTDDGMVLQKFPGMVPPPAEADTLGIAQLKQPGILDRPGSESDHACIDSLSTSGRACHLNPARAPGYDIDRGYSRVEYPEDIWMSCNTLSEPTSQVRARGVLGETVREVFAIPAKNRQLWMAKPPVSRVASPGEFEPVLGRYVMTVEVGQ